jgi:SAM-dependent methyltransferase
MILNDVQRSSQEQFGRQSHRYAKGHVLQNINDLREALSFLSLPLPAEILDVAAGAGNTGLFFAGLGHRVTLSDIAQPMLDRAIEAAHERGLRIQTRVHPAEEFPFPDESFDLVSSRVAPHHFSSPQAFVRECSRTLRRHGYLLIIDGTVEDGQPEAEAWMHEVEKLRDPSHQRLITPRGWCEMCAANGLTVERWMLRPFKQPDLNWYFDTAATSHENREKVLNLIEHAPESARKLFGIAIEDGKTIWWWQRLTLIARKN